MKSEDKLVIIRTTRTNIYILIKYEMFAYSFFKDRLYNFIH